MYVPLGGTVTLPLWLTVRPGFTEPVSLAALDLPPGVTITFQDNPIRNFTVATVTVREGSGVLPLVTIEGRANSARAIMKLVINVPTGSALPPPTGPTRPAVDSYSLAITQPSAALVKGGDALAFRITISRRVGNDPAFFAVTGPVPAGIITSFTQNNTLGNEAYLFVSAGTMATAGTSFPLTITANINNETLTMTVTVSVA